MCLIHPSSNHTWGECYLNAKNKHQPQPKNGNGKKGQAKTKTHQVNGQVALIEAKDMSITSTINSPEGEGSKSTLNESTPRRQPAVNDDGTVSMEVNGMLAQRSWWPVW
jgi:hypothetical protein